MQNPPKGSTQLTPDKELYKIINEPGPKLNHKSTFNDTAVGVQYVIKSDQGIIDYTAENDPTYWVIGDSEAESSMFYFLPIAVRTMFEGEVATYYFTRTYLLGDATVVTCDGRCDNSATFEATVHLLKATPLSEIQVDPEPKTQAEPEKQPEPNTTEEAQKPSEEEKADAKTTEAEKTVETEKSEEDKQRARFALNQLAIADDLFAKGKPAMARKEYNRARMAWGNQVDLSKAPATIDSQAMSLDMDSLKAYVESRALFGNANTFLKAQPPSADKAIQSLREAIQADPTFEEARSLFKSLGGVDDGAFPKYDDQRLISPKFWQGDIPVEHRFGYATFTKRLGMDAFNNGDFKEAEKDFNRSLIPFTRVEAIGQEKQREMQEIIVTAKLNALACNFELKHYRVLLANADLLVDYIAKIGGFETYLLKCLYRKSLAMIKLNELDKVSTVFAEMKKLPGSSLVLNDLNEKIEEAKQINVRDEDFLYKKMTGTL